MRPQSIIIRKTPFHFNGTGYEPGDVVEVPYGLAAELVNLGRAEMVPDDPQSSAESGAAEDAEDSTNLHPEKANPVRRGRPKKLQPAWQESPPQSQPTIY